MKDLLRVIEQVRARIEKHRAELQKSEALTRYVLIDPILRALGWETEDPDQVRPEFPTETGTPDYALKQGGKPQIMIEAKRLGSDLEEARRKGFQYCFENKVRFYAITDGVIWRVWDLGAEIGGKELIGLDILKDPPGEAIRKLLALWRPAAPQVKVAPSSIAQPSPPPLPGITLSELKVKVKRGDKPPQLVIFPDGQREIIKTWNGLLATVAHWVIPKLRRGQIPIRTGPKGYLLNSEPIHLSGRPFDSPKKVNKLWLETNWSAPNHVRHACRLLETIGVSPDEVRVEI